MIISSSQVVALRSALAGDGGTFDHLTAESDVDFRNKFAILTANAFVIAARRRFSRSWSTADVIRFVGSIRARNQGEQADVKAEAAERMLVSALSGEPMHGELDEFDKGYAQFALLAELVSDLDGRQLDTLLEQAREEADRWLASDHSA